jgi:hypothetical protein
MRRPDSFEGMQRASFRVFSAIVAAWLAIVLAEPAALHICAEHDARPDALVAASQSHAAGGHDHAAMEHGARSPSGHADAPAAHQCACLGHCVGSSAAGSAPVVVVEAGSIRLAVGAIWRGDDGFSPPGHEFLLPFANGPPSIA